MSDKLEELRLLYETSENTAGELEAPMLDEPVPSDEPVEITPSEAVATDIPLPAEDSGHLTHTVCDVCLELNLTTKSVIRCARCEQAFCLHYASTVDAQYCINCLSDITVAKSVITKTYEHRNAETGQHVFYRRNAREIKITGLDWLFAQRKIVELSDLELDLAIEYHRNILSLMITEQERQRNAKMHRYAGMKFTNPAPPIETTSSSTTTTVKKTRTVSKNKAQEQLAALLKQMQAKGMTIDSIAKMLKK